jgi:hypothetical protein
MKVASIIIEFTEPEVEAAPIAISAGATFPFARGVGCETLTPRFIIYYIQLNRCFGDLSERGILKFSTVCEDNDDSSQLKRSRETSGHVDRPGSFAFW